MKFKYVAYDSAAKKISGVIDSETKSTAKQELGAMSLRPIRLVKITENSSQGLFSFMNSAKPNLKELSAFLRQLATMQGAGMPLVQSLEILAQDVPNKNFAVVLQNVKNRVESGSSFAEALNANKNVFDKLLINLVSAGEMSGALEEIFKRLSIYYEKMLKLKRIITKASTYPLIILGVVVMVVFGMLAFIVPRFKTMFEAMNKELPFVTEVLIKISTLITSNIIWIVLGFGVSIIGFIQSLKHEDSRRVIDSILISMPLFGEIAKKGSIAKFCRTLGTLLQSGVSVLDGLLISSSVAGNYEVQDAILLAQRKVKQGNPMASSLAKSKHFPNLTISMISVGESTGSLDNMLSKLAEFYEDEVEFEVETLTTFIEPLMIIVVGIVVLGILIALYLPLMNVADLV